MSDIGLYSGLYESIRRWANLIDQALLQIKSDGVLSGDSPVEKLAQLLTRTSDPNDDLVDFSDQRVMLIIGSKLGPEVSVSRLVRGLTEPVEQKHLLPVLESIAHCLAEEEANTVARMRWVRA
jgi:hypothetical protein